MFVHKRSRFSGRNCCPFIGIAANEFTSFFRFLTSSFSCASLPTNRPHRRLRARCADARFDWARSKACRVYSVHAPLRPGRTKQMALHERQCAHDRRRNRTFQKRRPRRANTFAAPRTNRDERQSRHCYASSPRYSPLAEMMIIGRPLPVASQAMRLPYKFCVKLEGAKRSPAKH